MIDKRELSLDLRSMYPKELQRVMAELGEKPFKAKQLFEWLHQKGAKSYEEMTNLSKDCGKSFRRSILLRTLKFWKCRSQSWMVQRNFYSGFRMEM